MRVVLHAGLHKAATTFVQGHWGQAFADPDAAHGAWYPSRANHAATGHHYLAWPLLGAYTGPDAADLVFAHHARSGSMADLGEVVDRAAEQGTRTLLLSSEDLDRVRPDDVAGIMSALRGHECTVVLTATQPIHRWCATWQTMVRHGLADYPRDAAALVTDLAVLVPGRLEEVLRLLPAARRIVRVVRNAPSEPSLARDLAVAVGLPDPGEQTGTPTRNPSLGIDIEVVLRLNRAGLALGTGHGGRALLDAARGSGFDYEHVPALAERFAVPEEVWEAARAEQTMLTTPPSDLGLEVLDPHDVLGGWLDHEPPAWYADISTRRAVVPSVPDTTAADTSEQLWRLRQEHEAVLQRLAKVEEQLVASRTRAAKRARTIARLEARLDDPGPGEPVV